jgi:hypothetical protein
MRDQVRETFFLAFSSLAEPVHSGSQRSRARRLLARRERTLDGEDRGESMVWGGKGLILQGAESPWQRRKL